MIGIIGAGISGLSVAYFLKKQNIDCILLEANAQAGGNLKSDKKDGYLLEYGANSILIDQEIASFLEELGLKDELIEANDLSKNRFIFKDGRYQKLPSSPPNLLFNSFFSWQTKIQIFKELFNKSKSPKNETLSNFFERRFNKEITDYALNPFVSGIYAGDPTQLLLHKTFPILLDYEQKHGSVIKGLIKNKDAERKKSVSFKDGMNTLPLKIAEKLTVLYQHSAQSVEFADQKWKVICQNSTHEFEKLIICLPAEATANLLKNDIFAKINYPPMTVVHSVFKKADVGFDLNGFGGLNPKIENTFSAGSIWSSSIFKGRSKENEVLFTSFVGGSQFAKNALLAEEDLLEKLTFELQKSYQIKGKPIFQQRFTWEKSIPQYDKNVLEIENLTQQMTTQNLFFCVNWIGGVSITDCIKKGKKLANKLLE